MRQQCFSALSTELQVNLRLRGRIRTFDLSCKEVTVSLSPPPNHAGNKRFRLFSCAVTTRVTRFRSPEEVTETITTAKFISSLIHVKSILSIF